MIPEVGSSWRMHVEWRGRPYPQHGTWTYVVRKVEGEWVDLRVFSQGEAGVDHARILVQAFRPEGFISKKGHHVHFVPA